MVVKNLSLLTALALSGCATFTPIDDLFGVEEESESSEFSQNIEEGTALASSLNFQKQFSQKYQQQRFPNSATGDNSLIPEIKHDINYYVRGLMQDLVANLQYVNSTTPVAVVSFVMLDSNYNDSNLLGIQIAESLIHEVHKFGIPVIDFKTTGYIRITEQGDFAFSKDYQDFGGEMPARYIVGGTMLKHTDGYLINARIVGMKSQAVVASAQMFIPNSVSDAILMKPEEPKLPISNTTVELASMGFSVGSDPSIGTTNSAFQQQTMQETGSLNQMANVPLTNKIFLIQE